MRIGHGKLQLDVGSGGQRDRNKAVEPEPGKLAALGAIVPVLAQLDGDAGRGAIGLAQDSGHAGDGLRRRVAKSRPGLGKHEADDRGCTRGITQAEPGALEDIVGRALAAHGIEVDAMPAVGGIMDNGQVATGIFIPRRHLGKS